MYHSGTKRSDETGHGGLDSEVMLQPKAGGKGKESNEDGGGEVDYC